MADEEMSGFDPSEEEWIKEQRENEARRKKRNKKREEAGGSLNINSMMDIMVIILVFLLKSYGDEPMKVVGEDLKAPSSMAQLDPEDMTTITISQRAILVDDKKAVSVDKGTVDKTEKKGGARDRHGRNVAQRLGTLHGQTTREERKDSREAPVEPN